MFDLIPAVSIAPVPSLGSWRGGFMQHGGFRSSSNSMNLLVSWSIFIISVVTHYSVMNCNDFLNPPFHGLFFQVKVLPLSFTKINHFK